MNYEWILLKNASREMFGSLFLQVFILERIYDFKS